jgi:CelD/BcsL family acetyltransferase involved in cellulose biosynthesis
MFECATTDYADALNRFIRIEMSGWKGARGSAIGCSDRTLLFYKRIADEFAEAGKLRMYTLWLDHTAIAMELGLVTDGTYFSPKATYDERFASFSPGHLLTQHIISDLACTNISKYDFLGPHARHKALWAGEVLPHANYRIFRPSFLGHMRHLLVGEIAPLIRRAKRTLLADPQQRPLSNSVI